MNHPQNLQCVQLMFYFFPLGLSVVKQEEVSKFRDERDDIKIANSKKPLCL
jgi:hypothetical protein